jgi:hypothetical protein
MTAQAFKSSWTTIDGPLSPISTSRLNRFNFSKGTYHFLSIAGLPFCCKPDLSFVNNTDDIIYGINKLIEQYDFEEDKAKFDKYIVIGSCHDGDPIAVDTSDNDKIVELDHEDLFSSMYFNSCIEAMADFLILYRDFENEVLLGKEADNNFQCFNFTNEQFVRLKSKMQAIDNNALTERGFWKEQLEIMLSIRQQKFANL